MDRGHGNAPLSSAVRRRAAGFTLLEVLVALAVLATTMTALVLAGTNRTDGIGYMRDRTIATWIAGNRLTALRLERTWPRTGTREGEARAAGRAWSWQARISNTPDENIRKVEVTVSPDGSTERLARLVGYIGDPRMRSARGASP